MLPFVAHHSAARKPLVFVVSTHKPRQKERHCQEAHPHHPCYHDFVNRLTWLQVTSMVRRGDAATETTSVLSTKPLQTLRCQRRRALHPLWGPSSIPNNWADVCGFLKPPGSDRCWKVRMHGAFSIPRKTLGLRPNDQSCHHETWLPPGLRRLAQHSITA